VLVSFVFEEIPTFFSSLIEEEPLKKEEEDFNKQIFLIFF
jgi:hypothetical protein